MGKRIVGVKGVDGYKVAAEIDEVEFNEAKTEGGAEDETMFISTSNELVN